MVAVRLRTNDAPTDDQIVVLYNLTWQDYQRLLAARGDVSSPRMSFLKGALEIMSPSRSHESITSRIGCLVEAYCMLKGIELEAVGSWTLKDEKLEQGLEPDECYIVGEHDSDRPDLAIEVVWTSGGINKLEVYRSLGVREVWYWRLGKITIHLLRDDVYEQAAASTALPGIDLEQLASFLDRPKMTQAVREYRAALEAAR